MRRARLEQAHAEADLRLLRDDHRHLQEYDAWLEKRLRDEVASDSDESDEQEQDLRLPAEVAADAMRLYSLYDTERVRGREISSPAGELEVGAASV